MAYSKMYSRDETIPPVFTSDGRKHVMGNDGFWHMVPLEDGSDILQSQEARERSDEDWRNQSSYEAYLLDVPEPPDWDTTR